MFSDSIFIEIPFADSFNKDVCETPEQYHAMYDLIVKAFMFKKKFETLKESGNFLKGKQFDLNDVKVFNNFVNEVDDNIYDPAAKKYVLETIRQVRDNNFKKKTVKTTYDTLYEMLNPNKLMLKNLRSVLGHSLKLVDFCYIFKKCNKVAFTKDSSEIKTIQSTYDAVMKMAASENFLRLF